MSMGGFVGRGECGVRIFGRFSLRAVAPIGAWVHRYVGMSMRRGLFCRAERKMIALTKKTSNSDNLGGDWDALAKPIIGIPFLLQLAQFRQISAEPFGRFAIACEGKIAITHVANRCYSLCKSNFLINCASFVHKLPHKLLHIRVVLGIFPTNIDDAVEVTAAGPKSRCLGCDFTEFVGGISLERNDADLVIRTDVGHVRAELIKGILEKFDRHVVVSPSFHVRPRPVRLDMTDDFVLFHVRVNFCHIGDWSDLIELGENGFGLCFIGRVAEWRHYDHRLIFSIGIEGNVPYSQEVMHQRLCDMNNWA